MNSSEALLHAPDILLDLLTLVFQDWPSHGTITESVPVCVVCHLAGLCVGVVGYANDLLLLALIREAARRC